MKLLLNQDFPETSYRILKDAGYNVRYLGGRNSGATDQDVIDILYKDKRTYVSMDKHSSRQFLMDGFTFPGGIIVFDTLDFDDQFPAKILVKMSSSMGLDFREAYTVIKKDVITQRQYSA